MTYEEARNMIISAECWGKESTECNFYMNNDGLCGECVYTTILEALEKQSKIVHCKDCENWKIITIETIYGRTTKAGQCELTKWLCGEQGYCMYGREVE